MKYRRLSGRATLSLIGVLALTAVTAVLLLRPTAQGDIQGAGPFTVALTMQIGPIDGLTSIWHPAPDTTAIPLGTVALFKDRYGLSRKWAIPLLEYLDSSGVTRRAGDERLLVG